MTQTFNNWPLAKKMLAVFGFVALLISALGVTAVFSNYRLAGVATKHVTRGIAGTESLGRVLDELREHRIILWTLVSAQNNDEVRRLQERYAGSREELRTAMSDYAPLAGNFQGQFDRLTGDIETLERVNGRILEASGTGANLLALVRGPGREASDKAIREGEELITMSNARSAEANRAGEATATTTMIFTVALLLFSMGALFVVWRLIVSSVAVPLGKVTSTTTLLAEGGTADVPYRDRKDELGAIANAVEAFRMAAVNRAEADARNAAEQAVVTTSLRDSLALLREGDLTSTITVEFPSAYGELKTNFNEALEALRELIGSVLESTASIRTGSTEIAQASEDLARRTESNAASLEETSAAVTQMDDRLKATAEAAKSTVERADGAIATVSGGRGIADEAVQAMGRVSESAKGIDSVIEGLDKIAFQTRVLAMNAAVEAGRAGEAGRGFAVVADLVSALAMRAEEEAGRARDQLTATQTDIVAAVDMVQKVDGALAHIVDDVSEVHKLLGEMAQDNEAQSSAITQISSAIASMDQSTQQNAAMVEQTSAAARTLNSEIGGLADQAARFRVDAGAVSRTSMARAVAAAAPAQAKRRDGSIYVSPVKPLPAAAVAKLTAPSDDEWASF